MVDYLSHNGHKAGDVFAALADPTRRAIVARLAESDATINELSEPFASSLQAIAKHVRVLERAGIVRCEKIGRSNHCKLNAKTVRHATDWLQNLESRWSDRLDAIGEYLKDSAPPSDRK